MGSRTISRLLAVRSRQQCPFGFPAVGHPRSTCCEETKLRSRASGMRWVPAPVLISAKVITFAHNRHRFSSRRSFLF
jgi:hypothetical protein